MNLINEIIFTHKCQENWNCHFLFGQLPVECGYSKFFLDQWEIFFFYSNSNYNFIYISNFFTHPIKNHSIIELILCIIIGIIFLIPIFLVHEILHAIWFPKKAKKELWYEINRNSLFLFSFQIYSNCPLKRNRFLLMLLFPNIILALIPLFLWYCGIVFVSPFISRIIGSLLTILFTCGASDYSLFFDTILCTKKEDNIIIFA